MSERLSEFGHEAVKQNSLEALRKALGTMNYPNYPPQDQRLWLDDEQAMFEPPYLPYGPWETSEGALPTIPERIVFTELGLRHDHWGRPLHPWFDEMVRDPQIGLVTGKGFYWNWGPNYTADSVVFRHDKTEPQILLIKRKDTGQWALPGGFIDPSEQPLTAALRETEEETGLILPKLTNKQMMVYCGPLADIRVTANAWPETTAFRFDLPSYLTDIPVKGGDDAEAAQWFQLSDLNTQVFGSHRLIVELALARQ